MPYPIPMTGLPGEYFMNSNTGLTLDASILNEGFISLLEEHKVSKAEQISPLICKYRDDLFQDWDNTDPDRPDDIRTFAYNKILTELSAIADFSVRIWKLCESSTTNSFASGVWREPTMIKNTVPSRALHSRDSSIEPTLFSSPVAEMFTPASTHFGSPAIQNAQLLSKYSSVVNSGQDYQLYPSPQLTHASPGSATMSPLSYRPLCYKEVELDEDRTQTHKWFDEFLTMWIQENRHSTEYDLVQYINQHRHQIEDLFGALQGVDERTLDSSKWAQVKEGITQPQFYYAAVATSYSIDKRLRIGPIKRNGIHSITGDDMDGRVARVCSYYMACKNSCQRVCLPHFIDEIVDQTDKMLDRFVTNCKGNAAKKGRNDLKKMQMGATRTPRGGRTRKLDALVYASTAGSRASNQSSAPAAGVTKRRHNLPRGARPMSFINSHDDETEEQNEDDDEFDGDTIQVIPGGSSIDPVLLQSNLNADLGMNNLYVPYQPWR